MWEMGMIMAMNNDMHTIKLQPCLLLCRTFAEAMDWMHTQPSDRTLLCVVDAQEDPLDSPAASRMAAWLRHLALRQPVLACPSPSAIQAADKVPGCGHHQMVVCRLEPRFNQVCRLGSSRLWPCE